MLIAQSITLMFFFEVWWTGGAASYGHEKPSLIRREESERTLYAVRAAEPPPVSLLSRGVASSTEALPPWMDVVNKRQAAPWLSANGSKLPLDVKGQVHVKRQDSKLWNIVDVVQDENSFAGVVEPTPPPTVIGETEAAELEPESLPSTTKGVVGDTWTTFYWGWDENQSFKVNHNQDLAAAAEGEFYVTSTPAMDRPEGPSTTVSTASADSIWVSSTTGSPDDQLGIQFPRLR